VKVPDTSSSVTTNGAPQTVMDVILDGTELLHDALISPSLEGAAEIDADELAQHAGIDALRDSRPERTLAFILFRSLEVKAPQPLTEPLAMPSMKRRCIKRKKARTGATSRIAAAMISPQSLLYWAAGV